MGGGGGGGGSALLCEAEAAFAAELVGGDRALLGGVLGGVAGPLGDPFSVTHADGSVSGVEPRPDVACGRLFRVVAPRVEVDVGGGATHAMQRGEVAAAPVEALDGLVRAGGVELL